MSEQRLPRRAFLGYASLGASAVWMPRWLAAGFGAGGVQETPSRTVKKDGAIVEVPSLELVLRQGIERARVAGKPLLVFVVPTDPQCVLERQVAFGQYLNLCDDEALADLALCEVVCAREADLEAVIPGTSGLGEPLFVLVETDGFQPAHRTLDARLEQLVWRPFERAQAQEDFERQVTRRVQRMAALVGGGVASDLPTLERRALQARKALGEQAGELVERVLADPGIPADIDRVAAVVRLAAEQGDRRDMFITALSNSARSRLRLQPPSGAWWAFDIGCGHHLEGYTEYVAVGGILMTQVACGMGHVPELSQRFLHFYTTCNDR